MVPASDNPLPLKALIEAGRPGPASTACYRQARLSTVFSYVAPAETRLQLKSIGGMVEAPRRVWLGWGIENAVQTGIQGSTRLRDQMVRDRTGRWTLGRAP
jgi:hypothetical protein